MAVKIEGMAALQANIQKLANQVAPKAAAKAINKVARSAIKNGTKNVSKEIHVPAKLIRKRTRLSQKATANRPVAKIRVDRRNLPLIRLLENPRRAVRASKGQIRIGKYSIQRGFIQTLANGRRQVMQRGGKARYSIDVVKIPLAAPLTNAFHHELKDYSEQVKIELTKELSAVFRK
ncbi:phage tail protein [Haemophilus influenzae]|uniref:phage tail protein n=1 Tax=Haemophilus influenzae TaxID=727 RepID=UPI000E56CC52|nr:phage tail protein [Haemophilus influenzae]MCK9053448.1 phage tail protein [Haemophilus influenzae]BBF07630.1 tail protein [Haemophilus influenzae]